MIRTQIYITESEKRNLTLLSTSTGKSQSELIRFAIDSFVEKSKKENKQTLLLNAFGMWGSNEHDFEETRNSMDR